MVGVVAWLSGEMLVEVLSGCTSWFSRVLEAFQKVGLCNSSPCRCNRFRPDTILFRVVSVTDPVSIHLKDLDGWESMVLQLVVDLQVGAERGPLGVESGCSGG